MPILVKNSIFPTGYRLFTKGAAENAMMYSDKYIDKKMWKFMKLIMI